MGGSYAGWWGGALFPGLCAAPSSGWWVGAREGILGGGWGSPVRVLRGGWSGHLTFDKWGYRNHWPQDYSQAFR